MISRSLTQIHTRRTFETVQKWSRFALICLNHQLIHLMGSIIVGAPSTFVGSFLTLVKVLPAIVRKAVVSSLPLSRQFLSESLTQHIQQTHIPSPSLFSYLADFWHREQPTFNPAAVSNRSVSTGFVLGCVIPKCRAT